MARVHRLVALGVYWGCGRFWGGGRFGKRGVNLRLRLVRIVWRWRRKKAGFSALAEVRLYGIGCGRQRGRINRRRVSVCLRLVRHVGR